MQLIYKFIYHPLINSFLLKINKLLSGVTAFKLPPSGIIDISVNSKLGFKMATNQTSYVTKLLYWQGSDSFEYSPIFKELISNCKSFIDIGANTGYYSLLGATINPDLKVYAFEPAKGPLHYFNQNILLNELQNSINVFSLALSNRTENVHFYEVKNKKYTYLKYNLGGVGSLKEDKSKEDYIVPSITLDGFIKENSITEVSLIKIDTEGTEHLILEGAFETIENHKPIIICETLFNKIEEELESTMKQHGYLFFNHVNGKLQQVNSLKRARDNGIRDCFFVHPSKVQLVNRFI